MNVPEAKKPVIPTIDDENSLLVLASFLQASREVGTDQLGTREKLKMQMGHT